MNQAVNKLLASMLVITLTLTNLILLGTYATESFALSEELENQETVIKDKVDFDAYFLNEKGEKTHTKTIDITSQEETLYLSITVLEGYLRNAKMELTDTNFQMEDVSANYEAIQSITEKEIVFNQIAKGNENRFEIPIKVNKADTICLNDFTKENQITIRGSVIGNNGKTTSIENTIKANLNLHGQATLSLAQQVTKFTPYQIEGNSGFMIQTTVTSGIENNILPIEETNLSIAVPTLKDGSKPSKVNVSANSLVATKNDTEGISFTEENWNYNEENGSVSILIKNEKNEQEIVNWGKNGLDEFVITYIFENKATPTEMQVHLQATLQIKAYNNEVTQLEKTEEQDITLGEKIGDIVTFEIESQPETLGKGYLYANSNYETEYQITWKADLGYIDFVDQITMNQTEDRFLDQKGQTYSTTVGGIHYAYYKSTQIAKENFTKILGTDENAYIHIYDKTTNTLLATIDNQTQVDENGNLVVNYESETNNLLIQTSKPVQEGILEIKHTKAIKAKTDYSKEQLKSFTTLQTNLNGAISNENVNIVEMETTREIGLTEPSTKIDAFVNNEKEIHLSTVTENENVEFKIVLQNTDITSDLFTNPVIEVVFPSYIETIKVNSISLLFDEELTFDLSNVQTYTKEDGRLAMKIPVTGTQTVYNWNQTQNGTNLVITANITAKQLTPNTNSVIEVYSSNENATSYAQEKEGRAYQELKANFVAPTGMVTVNTMSDYNEKQEKAVSISGQEVIGELPIQSGAKTAKVTLTVINNYEETCRNINILGRIPFEGNTSITSGESLGSTFTAKMVSGMIAESGISSENMTVYYTQNGEATNDLTNESNGWTTDIALQDVKSYLIVFNHYEMQPGETMTLSYQVEIPENLQHNESTYGIYAVYFDNETQLQELQIRSVSSTVGVSTMEGPELEASIAADVENGAEIKEGQVVKYTVTIKNVGDTEANNLSITSKVPEGMVYAELEEGMGLPTYQIDATKQTVEIPVNSILAGTEYKTEFYLQVGLLGNVSEKTVTVEATVISIETNDQFKTQNVIEHKIVKGCLDITIDATKKGNSTVVEEGEIIFYQITIKNVNQEEKTNVKIENQMTEGLSLVEDNAVYVNEGEIEDNIQINRDTNTWTYELSNLKANGMIYLYFHIQVDQLGEGQTEATLQNITTVTCDQEEEPYRETATYTVGKPSLEISQTSDIAPGEILEEEKLEYTITVKNTGKGTAQNVTVTDMIPDGLLRSTTTYTVGNETFEAYKGNGNAMITTDLEKEQTLVINIVTYAEKLGVGETEREVTNRVTVKADGIDEMEANTLTHIITADASNHKYEYPNTNSTYRISGTVWIDADENGQKDDNEEVSSGIQTMLVNGETGEMISETTTNQAGTYSFDGLEKGTYMVTFVYDTGIYTITDYQKSGVNESRNSDAIETNSDGINAITDNITITSTNVYNIDLGLVLRNKFDLSLTKSISNITVKTTAGTRNYTYDAGTTFAKIDIAPKRIDGAEVVVEYKIAVTNEGNMEGFVRKIADYIPSEFKFSSSLNKQWYQAEDGAIYNTSLADTIIQPGETKEVTLILTKTMTGESTGVVSNTAEIQEDYNDLGLEDMNSTPANKAQGENDLGTADVLLTVNTGGPVLYIGVTIVILGILAIGIYLVKKKYKRK